MKAWKQYPNVRAAWQSNLDLYNKDPTLYFKELKDYLCNKTPEWFRLHSSGDMPDENYWLRFRQVAAQSPWTSFLVFTKRYDFDYTGIPWNVSVILSTWPGTELPTGSVKLPKAWLEEDSRKPKGYFKCGGHCQECGYFCWSPGRYDVVFTKH